jgi:multidrug efflux system membrane fusion protein
MKRWWKWIVAAVVVLLVAGLAARVLSARKAQQQAQAQAAASKTVTVVELAATDTTRAQIRELEQGLPVTGALKAVTTAFVKARVPGELQGLTVREGDAVKAGQVVARIEPTEYQARLRQAQDQANAAKVQIDIAQRQFDNNRALMEKGFISKTALDTSAFNLSGAQASYQAALAAADVARKTLADTVLVAPINGLVSQRLAQPGERVPVDGRIIEIVDLSRVELEAAVSASDAPRVRVGQNAVLKIEGNAEPVKARVARINPSTQAGSRSILVYLAVEPTTVLRQGLFAEGMLGTGRLTTLTVPVSALRTDKPQPYVQVVENGKIAHKSVVPGARGDVAGAAMVAVSGLPEDAVVVTGARHVVHPRQPEEPGVRHHGDAGHRGAGPVLLPAPAGGPVPQHRLPGGGGHGEYPGASPEIVESEVTKKIEEGVNSIAGINALTSRSYEGQSVVIIEFQLHIDGARRPRTCARRWPPCARTCAPRSRSRACCASTRPAARSGRWRCCRMARRHGRPLSAWS